MDNPLAEQAVKEINARDALIKDKQEREKLEDIYLSAVKLAENSFLRMLLENDRIDIFATDVLGYTIMDFHNEILQFQDINPRCVILAPRGSGKSTIGTVVRALWEIVKNPDIRILIVSNTQLQAEVFLREIKNHIEGNDKFRQYFGDLKSTNKWDNREIEISTRKARHKESTITCLGVGGAIVGRHYDLILADDLVDEENSRTELQRERLRVWFYKVLDPTLIASGRFYIAGTRYYPSDLYGHLIKNDPQFAHKVLPAILKSGQSLWPLEMPIDWLLNKRKAMGTAIFNTQYMNDIDAMEGKIFKYETFKFYKVLPSNLKIYQGIDLAISQRETADEFVIVTIGKDEFNNIYLIDVFNKRLGFTQQVTKIKQKFTQYDPMRVYIEANAYQASMVQSLLTDTNVRAVPIFTIKDKVTRAWKLAHKFESGQVFLPEWGAQDFIDQMIAMPDVDHDDIFDAFDIAITGTTTRVKKPRPAFGVL